MTSINEMLQKAKQQSTTKVKSVPKNIEQGVKTVMQQRQNEVLGKITGTVGTVVNTGTNAVVGAASQVMRGDISGAADTILRGGKDVANTIGGAFGINMSGGEAVLTPSTSIAGAMSVFGAATSTAGGNALAGALARADPMLSFLWYAEFPPLFPKDMPAQYLPWYYAEEATVPFRTYNTVSIFREGRQRHYPGTYNVDNLRISFYMDTSNVALDYLFAWHDLILSPTTIEDAATKSGLYGRPVDYKKNIIVYLLSPDKRTLAKLTYTECWPTNLDSLNLVSGSSERLVAHVNFSVGDVFVELQDSNAFNDLGDTFVRTAADQALFDANQVQ